MRGGFCCVLLCSFACSSATSCRGDDDDYYVVLKWYVYKNMRYFNYITIITDFCVYGFAHSRLSSSSSSPPFRMQTMQTFAHCAPTTKYWSHITSHISTTRLVAASTSTGRRPTIIQQPPLLLLLLQQPKHCCCCHCSPLRRLAHPCAGCLGGGLGRRLGGLGRHHRHRCRSCCVRRCCRCCGGGDASASATSIMSSSACPPPAPTSAARRTCACRGRPCQRASRPRWRSRSCRISAARRLWTRRAICSYRCAMERDQIDQ